MIKEVRIRSTTSRDAFEMYVKCLQKPATLSAGKRERERERGKKQKTDKHKAAPQTAGFSPDLRDAAQAFSPVVFMNHVRSNSRHNGVAQLALCMCV